MQTVKLKSRLKSLGFTPDEIVGYFAYIKRKQTLRRNAKSGRTSSSHYDTGMSRVYVAEEAFLQLYGKNNIEDYATIKDAQKFANRVLKSKTWKKVRLNKRNIVKLEAMKNMGERARVHATSHGGKIRMSPTALNKYTLIHELAHEAGTAHHDVGFRKILVALVSRFIGRDAAKLLKSSFKSSGLKMTISTKIKPPKEWLILSRRLAESRLLRQSE